MQKRKGLSLLGMATILLFMLISVTQPARTAPAAAAASIRIAKIIALSGPSAYDGMGSVQGTKLAIKKINDSGGVLGRPLQLVVYDDKNVPEEGVAALKRGIAEGIKLYVGTLASSVALAMNPIVRDQKVLMIYIGAMHPNAAGQGNVFAMSLPILPCEQAHMSYLEKMVQFRTAWIMVDNSDFGRGTKVPYEQRWTGQGGLPRLLGSTIYEPTQTDFTTTLTKIKKENPDILILSYAGGAATLSLLLTQAPQVGFRSKQLFFVSGTLTEDIIKLAGKYSEGVMGSDFWIANLKTKQNQEFVQSYKKEYKGDSPTRYSQRGYEATLMIADAIKRTGNAEDIDKLNHAILKTDVIGTQGVPLGFDAATGRPSGRYFPTMVVNQEIVAVKLADGKIVPSAEPWFGN